MNLSAMSLGELKKLGSRIEKEIESRNKKQRGQALGEIKTIATKYGLKLEEILSEPAATRKPRKVAAKKVAKAAKKPAVILYRHPENPQLTWPGGRGRRPQWIKDWEASGRSLDEARVANG
ncbi:MAG: H-NS histone family protein [Rhodocyclaceae bacterium]|nr:H-NS histone family protein [Rhodocyclaceae bacterium]